MASAVTVPVSVKVTVPPAPGSRSCQSAPCPPPDSSSPPTPRTSTAPPQGCRRRVLHAGAEHRAGAGCAPPAYNASPSLDDTLHLIGLGDAQVGQRREPVRVGRAVIPRQRVQHLRRGRHRGRVDQRAPAVGVTRPRRVNVAVPPTSRSTVASTSPVPPTGHAEPAEATQVQVGPSNDRSRGPGRAGSAEWDHSPWRRSRDSGRDSPPPRYKDLGAGHDTVHALLFVTTRSATGRPGGQCCPDRWSGWDRADPGRSSRPGS